MSKYMNKKSKSKNSKGHKNKNSKTQMFTVPLSKGRITTFNNESKRTRVKRKEFLMDVGPGATSKMGHRFKTYNKQNGLVTSIANIAVNAGVVGPWLGTLAGAFEKFLFHTMKFEYVPTCPTTTDGSITMAYNSNPAKPETSVEESDYSTKSNSVQTTPWKGATLNVPLSKMQETTKVKLVRTGPLSGNDDANLTDNGIVDILHNYSGTNAGLPIGKLYIDYDVDLINPKISLPKVSALLNNLSVTQDLTEIGNYVRGDSNVTVTTGRNVDGVDISAYVRIGYKKPGSFFRIQALMKCTSTLTSPRSLVTPSLCSAVAGFPYSSSWTASTGTYAFNGTFQSVTDLSMTGDCNVYWDIGHELGSTFSQVFTEVNISVEELTISEVTNYLNTDMSVTRSHNYLLPLINLTKEKKKDEDRKKLDELLMEKMKMKYE